MATRTQLSLFVPDSAAAPLERVRARVDPLQHRLIPAHVTLCREDELAEVPLESLLDRLGRGALALTVQFGAPERVQEHGLLLPCIGGQQAFQQLRVHLLGAATVRDLAPHITLAHPRNPKAAGNALENAAHLAGARSIHFEQVQLIDQTDGGPWQVRRTFVLAPGPGAGS